MMNEIIKLNQTDKGMSIEARARAMYKQIMRQLVNDEGDGTAECELYGVRYRFEYIDNFFGCEVYRNDEYAGDFRHGYEIREMIEDQMYDHEG